MRIEQFDEARLAKNRPSYRTTLRKVMLLEFRILLDLLTLNDTLMNDTETDRGLVSRAKVRRQERILRLNCLGLVQQPLESEPLRQAAQLENPVAVESLDQLRRVKEGSVELLFRRLGKLRRKPTRVAAA